MSRATMKDVARLAGVSVASVSYAFDKNKEHFISADTKRRVLEAARELNYQKNIAASGLRRQNCKCIGIVSTILDRPRFSQIIQGAVERLAENGYSAMLCPEESLDKQDSFVRFYLENRVDGFIYIGINEAPIRQDREDQLLEYGVPMVTFDCGSRGRFSSVHIDYAMGAFEAAAFLRQRHEVDRIVYISPGTGSDQYKEQLCGLKRAREKYGGFEIVERRPSEDVFQEKCGGSQSDFIRENAYHIVYPEKIRRLAEKAAAELRPGDGMICAWAGMEEYVMHELSKRDMRRPVVVLSQGYLRQELYNGLYYSYIPNHKIGYVCADVLMSDILDGEEDIIHKRVAPRLVIGED